MEKKIAGVPTKSSFAKRIAKPVEVSDHYWWKVVILSFFGWIFIYADRTVLNPTMPNIASAFHINNTSLGLINSVFFMAYALAQVPLGIIAEKVGRKYMIAFGFFLFGAMTFLSGIVTAFGAFLIVRAIAGLGEGAYYGPQYALSTEAIPPKRLTLGTAIINSGMAFGTSGGYLLSSILVLQNGGKWQQPFLIIAIPTILMGVLFTWILKEKIISPHHQKQTAKFGAQQGVKSKIDFKQILTNRNLLLSFFICFCSIYAFFVIITWLPQYLQVERGFTGSSVGFISSLVPWASIPGALIVAKLNDYLGTYTKSLVSGLMILSIISVLGIVVAHSRIGLLFFLVMYGLTGKLALDPILVAFVAKNAKNSQLATTLSMYNFVGMSGSVLAPYVTGYLADKTGTMTVGFYLAAILLVLGGIAFLFTSKGKAVTRSL
ncbi:MFS transporter [Liquorilactobacillus uvarum]|uniref:MFS transporter n=1 Tax=Liquorilactobacillus uvarum TaxID=303240 RepID=UPI00288AAEAC|nr:MFS transporter [Liquorilactobacillus uvarum]